MSKPINFDLPVIEFKCPDGTLEISWCAPFAGTYSIGGKDVRLEKGETVTIQVKESELVGEAAKLKWKLISEDNG